VVETRKLADEALVAPGAGAVYEGGLKMMGLDLGRVGASGAVAAVADPLYVI
jgi:hypothetical protein